MALLYFRSTLSPALYGAASGQRDNFRMASSVTTSSIPPKIPQPLSGQILVAWTPATTAQTVP